MKLKAVRHGVLSFQTGPNMFEGEDLGNEGGHPDLGGGGGSLEHQLQHEQLKMEHMAQVPALCIHPFLQPALVRFNLRIFLNSCTS